ncbi:MAG: glycosyltransferase family 2 protein [Candidatus Omnitrophota bacterium]
MLSLSVFIFAYNEAATLEAVVKEISGVLSGLGRPYEVVIIDDGSVDGTGALADKFSGQYKNFCVIHHDKNYGLGSVYKTAFANAKKDLITFFCADGQFPAEIIKQFLPLMDDKDMVLGFLPDRRDPLLSKVLSAAEKLLFRVIAGPMPKFQGVLMFRRELLDKIELKSGGGRAWTVLMEFIIKVSRRGYKVVSVATKIRPRATGRSKVNNLKTIWANTKRLFVLRRYV